MNRAQLEQGFAKLVELQRYVAASGAAIHVRKLQVDIEQAMQLIADAVNTEENPEPVKTEWQKRREDVWLRSIEITKWGGSFADADNILKEFESRFGQKKAAS